MAFCLGQLSGRDTPQGSTAGFMLGFGEGVAGLVWDTEFEGLGDVRLSFFLELGMELKAWCLRGKRSTRSNR